MYGYFRPNSSRLTKSEHLLFNAYYCRICYCLRISGGQRARFLTTFDAAVYSLILHIASGEQPPRLFPCQRFGKSRLKDFTADATGLRLARLTLIALGEKIADDRADERSLKAAFAGKLFRKQIAAAAEVEPELKTAVSSGLKHINAMQDGGESVFDILDAYGDMLVNIFGLFSPLAPEYERAYRALARWTFFVDMLCDYDEDYKNPHAYNAFKTDGAATLDEYFNTHYMYILELNARYGGELISALAAIDDGSETWRALFKIVSHAVATVVPNLFKGIDVKYRYFREQATRIAAEITKKGKSNFR